MRQSGTRIGAGEDDPDTLAPGRSKEKVLAIFATAPVLDVNDLRADLDEAVSQDVHDPYEGTGL